MATEVRYSWDGPKLTSGSSSVSSKQSTNSNGKDKFTCTKQIFESLQSSKNKLIQAKSPKLSSKNHQDSSTTAVSLESSSEPKLCEVASITAVQPMTPIDKKRLDVSAIILAFEERSKSTSSLPASMLSMGVSYRRKASHDNNNHNRPTSLIYPSTKRSNYFKNYVTAVTTPPPKERTLSSTSIHNNNNGSGDHQQRTATDVFSTSSSSEDYHHVESKYYNGGHGDISSSITMQTRSESDLKNNNSQQTTPLVVDDNCNPVTDQHHDVEVNNKSAAAISLRSKLEAYESLSESSSSIVSHTSPATTTITKHQYRESKVQKLSQSFEELATPQATTGGTKLLLLSGGEGLRSSSSVPNNLWEEESYDLISTTVDDEQEGNNDDQANYDLMPNDGDESSDDDDEEETMNTTYEINPPTPQEEDKSNETFPPAAVMDETFPVADEVMNETFDMDKTTSDKPEESKDLFYYEIAGLPHMKMESDNEYDDTSIPKHRAHKKRVNFSEGPIQVFIFYSKDEYDRLNDEADPIAATAEYELEKRLEKLIIFDVEIEKGLQPLGLSIVGIGVGADTGVEKLGMFVKTVVPGGSIHTDNRIQVNDQIIEVDGHSLVGVSQAYASNVLSNTKGTIHFKVGRETDAENSEIARLVNLSIQREQHYDDDDDDDEEFSDEDDYRDEFNQAMAVDDDCGDDRQYWNNDGDDDTSERAIKQEFAFEEENSSPPRAQVSLSNVKRGEARSLDDEVTTEQLDNNEIDNADVDAATIAELQTQLEEKQKELKESAAHSVVLERKYNKAKKLIKEFQTREQEFMRREVSYQNHISKLMEKHRKEKEEHEKRLQQQQQIVMSPLPRDNHVTNNSNNSSNSHRQSPPSSAATSATGESPQKQQPSSSVVVVAPVSSENETTDSGEPPPSSIYDNLTEDIIGELDNVLATNRPSNIFNTTTTTTKPVDHEKDEATPPPVRNSVEIIPNNSATDNSATNNSATDNSATNNSATNNSATNNSLVTTTDEIQRMMSQTLTMDKTYQITNSPIGKKSSNTASTYDDVVIQPNKRSVSFQNEDAEIIASTKLISEVRRRTES